MVVHAVSETLVNPLNITLTVRRQALRHHLAR